MSDAEGGLSGGTKVRGPVTPPIQAERRAIDMTDTSGKNMSLLRSITV